MASIESVRGFRDWIDMMPDGATITISELRRLATGLLEGEPDEPESESDEGWNWRTRLWTVPPETIMSAGEVAEAINRPVSMVYKRTSGGTIPYSKIDGVLVFTAGEIREWVRREARTDGR